MGSYAYIVAENKDLWTALVPPNFLWASEPTNARQDSLSSGPWIYTHCHGAIVRTPQAQQLHSTGKQELEPGNKLSEAQEESELISFLCELQVEAWGCIYFTVCQAWARVKP